ncbi:glycoside hydrolase family 92 protein [Sphingobacterium sp. lm-10]|uniref:glycoside hydrolase domain-containing protein n=1 Tax=Sphingobacterium sp. lm-10 TaxID=2944904 RepID=UPI002022985A|nr:glycoside hydrolase domain-containing protein [Sphingobacterium sp. lm-10]MCL7989236.1 glycoside hydrolase family 92 protein [Sphingobacterium sp. lm-10]
MKKAIMLSLLVFGARVLFAQVDQVNVFLGSSGDHGQLSPAASSAFHQLSIVPFTNPTTHTGYEFLAKEIRGFTHNRMEGVGCMGSGGVLLIQPYLGSGHVVPVLHKNTEEAGPGYYEVATQEGIAAQIVSIKDFGKEKFSFPAGDKGFFLDLGHAFNGAFVDNRFERDGNRLIGAVRAKTTCHVGTYTIYYALEIPNASAWRIEGNKVWVSLPSDVREAEIDLAFSAVNESYAAERLEQHHKKSYADLKNNVQKDWDNWLGAIQVKGDPELTKMFYSLFYRALQSPYTTSEADGSYRATDGEIYKSKTPRVHGWAVWDNYKTQLPLLELAYPEFYQQVASSLSDLYRYGKYDFAGPAEPANSVRTEHAAVVLLDAQRKGYAIDLDAIRDSLIRDTARFDFTKPDKYLEAAYDMWAMDQLFKGKNPVYKQRALSYSAVWDREFKDLTKRDVDRMSARNMYQGTIRQYRWNVPFDVKGLVTLAGGQAAFTAQLDDFYDNYYFNRANEPDLQSFTLYNASTTPWRYQEWVHRLALDTVVQYYFNDNSRGIGAHIDKIYKNEPKAFVRTMDDDAGAMSAWWVLSAIGLHQPLIGEPIYYLSTPFFDEVRLENRGKPFIIKRSGEKGERYIQQILWNGKDLGRLWITRKEIAKGGTLEIITSQDPTRYGIDQPWVTNYSDPAS